tara:strand:+ start:133 stop:258 length:126 start_codon:yes stop_codon:yes gene_type:complete
MTGLSFGFPNAAQRDGRKVERTGISLCSGNEFNLFKINDLK